MKVHFFSDSANQTKRIAKYLTWEILKNNFCKSRKTALVLALVGDLGSGKTTFTQGFLRAQRVSKRITSPTFVIMKRFEICENSDLNLCKFTNIYHIDCYRIHKSSELLKLGFKEIINNSQNIILIEWADKIKRILSKNMVYIKFGHGNKINQRLIDVKF